MMQPKVKPRDYCPGRKTNHLIFLAKKVLPALVKNKNSWPFLNPVDFATLKIYDYPEIIKYPMDLTSIKQRLSNDYYQNADECVADFELMFKNCWTFNNKTDDVSKMAVLLKQRLDLMLETMRNEPEVEVNPKKTIKKKQAHKRAHVSKNQKNKENIPPIIKNIGKESENFDKEFVQKVTACVDGFKGQLVELLMTKSKKFGKQSTPKQIFKATTEQAVEHEGVHEENDVNLKDNSIFLTEDEQQAILLYVTNVTESLFENTQTNGLEDFLQDEVDNLNRQITEVPEHITSDDEDDEPLLKRLKF